MASLSLLALAFGLAMDATAAAAARSLAAREASVSQLLRVPILFGGFQAVMPAIGWALGSSLGVAVGAWDHWIAFALLSAIGGKMIADGLGEDDGSVTPAAGAFDLPVLLLLALGTSVDALAAGVSLPTLGLPLVLSIATIGLVTAALSGLALVAGRRLGPAIGGGRLDVAGGVVLFLVGLKILVHHLSTGI